MQVTPKGRTALFIFRRDLRLADNTALLQSLKEKDLVIPCFIFDPRQVGSGNEFRSMNAIQFMVESLQGLEKQLKKRGGTLYLFYGKTEQVVKKIIRQENIDAVYVNTDYTPFSINRDQEIKKLCVQHEVDFVSCHDELLTVPGQVLTGNGDPYSIFTPFFKKASQLPVAKPASWPRKGATFYKGKIADAQPKAVYKKVLKAKNKHIMVHGGSSNAQKILRSLKKFKNYAQQRDYPAIPTTHLSAHNKFGTVSIRTVYHAIAKQLGKHHLLIQQLYWRDFFTHVAYFSPFVFGQPYKQKYAKLPWSKSKKNFERWCTGLTGFPIVDAGMRQLNTAGFMHNRVRMLVASFLVKDLHINWLWGEKYFAQQLVDYDPAVNNGNWQWCASTGCDAQPYFRIFNPWLQQKKFDPECEYIKHWVPELAKVPSKSIHRWYDKYSEYDIKYPKPLVDHAVASKQAKQIYKNV